ncbi:MAG: Wzz/FepE/Etk N-terminal domain-containing protein [Alphaproteobacteria bacterium]
MSENAPARKSSSGMAETRSLGADFSFNDIWLFLRRYVLTIALAVAASVAAAGYMAFSATPEFTATAQILIDPALSQALRDPARNNGGSGNLPLDTAQVEGQIAVLHSESIAFAVIDRLQLVDDPEFTGKGAPSLVKRVINFFTRGFELAAPSEPSAEFANYLKRRAAVEAFASNLDVRRVGPTYAINISYTSQYPEKAARIANATADAYIQGQLKVNGKAAQQGSEWLEKRLVQLRTQLSEAARRAELFKTGRDFRLPQTRSDVGGQGAPTVHRDVDGQPSDNTAENQSQNGTASRTPNAAPATRPVTLAELESTVESYRKIYETYQQAFADAVQRQSFPVANARVITAATRPLHKSSPRRKRMLALGAVAGLLAGLGIALLRFSMDSSVRSARQVRDLTGLPCLTLIPQLDRPPLLASNAEPQPLAPETADAVKNSYRMVTDAPFSPFSGSMKTLRNAILHRAGRHSVQCIGVTSAMPDEGKSTIAANLAALYSLTGRTLIIDADVHRATISAVLAPDAKLGLLEVVSGKAEYADAIISGTVAGEGLAPDVLPIVASDGPISYEMLTAMEMRGLLDSLRAHYETIILDLPPVTPIVDCVAIAALLDGVVTVAAWGDTPADVLNDVTGMLYTARANVLGVALNKTDKSMATVRWRKRWGYNYYRTHRGRAEAGVTGNVGAEADAPHPAE